MTFKADSSTIEGACGVGTWYNFSNEWGIDVTKRASRGGAGWHFVMYVVGQKSSEKFYKYAASRWPIIYESEIRLNVNSNNEVFFVIYDISKDPLGFGFDAADRDPDWENDDE